MSNIDWFRFENKDLDFPIYKKNPPVSKSGWVVLFIALFVGYFFIAGTSIFSGIIACVVLIVPVLYYLKWDYKAIFQKPSAKDVALAVALFVGYMVYSIVLGAIISNFGLVSAVGESSLSFLDIPGMIFSLMGEEFFKFIPFMFFLRASFKYSGNRKLSIILSMLIVMFLFACIHAYDFNTLMFALVIQGLGSIFEFIGYIKTKNILVSYITHLCTDVFIVLVSMLSF